MATKKIRLAAALSLTLTSSLLLSGCSSDNAAIEKCEKMVTARLRSPASAKFSGIKIHKDDAKNFNIEGSVDSQNGFGALIRSSFSCYVTDGDKVDLYSFY